MFRTLKNKFFKKPVQEKINDGAQEKWEKDGIWYKLDTGIAEGLCEHIASAILEKANVRDFVQYKASIIRGQDGRKHTGCVSKNFIPEGFEFYDMASMMEKLDLPMAYLNANDMMRNGKARIEELVIGLEKLPGLEHCRDDLAKMFRFDAIINNGDRTVFNFGVLQGKENGKVAYRFAPLFDHGQSFMLWSDGWKKKRQVEEIEFACTSRPFCASPQRQAEYAEELAGGRKLYTEFSKEDLQKALSECADVYPQEMLHRAEQAVLFLMEQNIEFFRGKEIDSRLKNILNYLNLDEDFHATIQSDRIVLERETNAGWTWEIYASKRLEICKDGQPMSLDDVLNQNADVYVIGARIAADIRETGEAQTITPISPSSDIEVAIKEMSHQSKEHKTTTTFESQQEQSYHHTKD